MNKRSLFLVLGLVFVWVSGLCADEGHNHADANEKLGTVSFPISCTPQEQKSIERGIALLHSFWFDEAQKQFEEAVRQDPQCAMAYWAEAIGLYRPLAYRPSDSDLKQGWTLVQKTQALGAKTQREREYIDALAVFYRGDGRD